MTAGPALSEQLLWSLVPLALVLLAYAAMLRGWRRRARRHDLPPLAAVGDSTPLLDPAEGRYVGTTTAGDWLDRVVARGLGTRSPVRLCLSREGIDVHRPAGAFRIPAEAVVGARREQGLAGKVVPPLGLLVVTWTHGGHRLDSGFRLADSASHPSWIEAISHLAEEAHA